MKHKDPTALRAARHAIAQQRLEGLKVPRSVIRDLNRITRGEIDLDKAMENFRGMIADGQVREQR